MKSTIKIPVTILLSLVVFILVLTILYYALGSPECDDLANTTAFHLMNTINEVSNENFPYWDYNDGVPSDNDIAYFRKAPIKLCQQRFGAYEAELRFWGGEPEYKIYYEKFPEPGKTFFGWTGFWTENYPWSGGAGSTLRFWVLLKGVSVGIELAARAPLIWRGIKTAMAYKRIASHIDEVHFNLFNFFRPSKLLDDVDFQAFLLRFKTVDGRKAIQIANKLTTEQFDDIVKGLDKAGFIKKSGNTYLIKAGAFVTDDTQRPATMTIKNYDEAAGEWTINHDNAVGYLRCDSCPGGVDLSQEKSVRIFTYDFDNNQIGNPQRYNDLTNKWEEIPPGDPDWVSPNNFEFPTTSGRELTQERIDELKRSPSVSDRMRAREMEAQWALDEIGVEFVPVDNLDALKGTNFYNLMENARPIKNELNNLASGINIEGVTRKFNIEGTVLEFGEIMNNDGVGMLKGFENAWNGPSADDIQKAILEVVGNDDYGINEKIYAMGISDTITPKADDYLNALIDPDVGLLNPSSINAYSGIGIQPSNFRTNAYAGLGDAIAIHDLTEDAALDYVKGLPNFADINIDDAELRIIYNDLNNYWNGLLDQTPEKMAEGWGAKYIVDWADGKASGARWVDVDDGFIIGLYKLDSRPWYLKWKDGKWVKVPKLVWYKARSLITPTNAIAMGMWLGQYEGCLGNSLCVYSHGALSEYPFYLNESAEKFAGNIRVWRPVSTWAEWAGYSTILMGIPEHPRFYVVGPCFAQARVWKTRYNGEDTIFIKPEKFDLNDTASNYCYADEDLINAYAWAWFASDVTDVVQLVVMGTKKYATGALKTAIQSKIWKIFDWVDPSSLIQAGIEQAISWPGEPYKPLTWKQMVPAAADIPIEIAREAKEEAEAG